MLDATKITTPIAQKPIPLLDDTHLTDPTTCRQLCGSLQYLTFTRPEITHVVNLICQHFQNPNMKDLRAIKRILRYIKGTLTFGIRYLSQSSLTQNAFCDADWASCPTTRQSTPLDFAFSLAQIALHGHLRSNLLSLAQVRKLSTMP